MTQTPERLCPTCGTRVPNGQRFCSNCGSHLADEANKPTSLSDENVPPTYVQTELASPTPPPPPTHYPSASQPDNSAYPGQMYSDQNQSYPNQGYQNQGSSPSYGTPTYATPQKGSSSGFWRTFGCITGIIVLVILAICGGTGYFIYRGASNTISNIQKTATATGGYTGTGSGSGGSNNSTDNVTPTVGPTITTALNTSVTYASNVITLVNVQQAQSFADDSGSDQSSGVARINLKEQNTSTQNADLVYNDLVRLILPGGNQAEPLSVQNNITPDGSVSRTNWIDFPVPTTVKPSQLTLILGTAKDAQISIPLTSNADLSKYKDKTSHPQKTLKYEGLNWTLTDATSSLSNTATQAKKGMMYVSLNFSVSNPTQNNVVESWNDYMRLKVGTTVSSPDSNTNFPISFDVGSTNKTGTVIFQVPQGTTSFTFILLGRPDQQIQQATTDFQIS